MPLAAHQTTNNDHHATRTQPQPKPPSSGILSIILRTLTMCILTSLFILCVTFATALLIHLCLTRRHLPHRRRRRRRNAFSPEDLLQLDEFEYCIGDDDVLDCAECVICLERICDGARCRILPKCCHVFHLNCIDAWLGKKAVCPICRGSVRLNAAEATRSTDQSNRLKMF